ncbi:MAG: substrate-binding domain-containing protein [Rhodospirillales bacterium]|nr:substrate-binding domain-containing protein [Rhodospirillales bacterium]
MLATGSPGELGLLKALATEFAGRTPATLQWVKAGSGAGLDYLKNRAVDAVMVHAPAGERAAVEQGWAVKRTLIGSNEFYIVGPEADPANVAAATSAADAYRRIAAAKAPFVSRGDNSGTHRKEMSIWKDAGTTPSGPWYVVTGDFMTASLRKADAIGGYFMLDSSTWLVNRKGLPKLTVLYRGDKRLVNTYHALVAPEGATPGRDVAARFVDFVASDDGQQIIREYGRDAYGEPLYQDAACAESYVD